MKSIEDYFIQAKHYSNNPQTPASTNLGFEAMKGLFDGSKQLYIHVNLAKDIVESVNQMKALGVQKIVVCGGYQSYKVADFLKQNNIPVIINRVFDLPMLADEDYDLPFKLPALLQKAGVKYCLAYTGDMEAMGSRNLPFSAGMAVAYGLSKEEAVAAISKNAAEILGIADKVGSLEVGKEATLFISEGDALDMRSNKVTYAFVKGKQLDLNDRQKMLYNKYKLKYTKK